MSAGTISATASNPRETKHADCTGGVDIDLQAKLPDGSAIDVEVTLHPAKSGAGLEYTLWLDAATLARLQEYPKRTSRQVQDAIEYAARKAHEKHTAKKGAR